MTADPWAVAAVAMHRAGVEIRPLETLADMTTAADVFEQVWQIPPGGRTEMHPAMLRALGHAGNYLVGAYATEGPAAGRMVAASAAFFGSPPDGSVHSHITGVLPGAGHGIGSAIKWHQRAWSLDLGLPLVTWTYDPLIARNSFFNITRLGARPVGYHVDFYGPMDDGPNRGQPTDRADVRWALTGDATAAAAAAVLDPTVAGDGPDVDALLAAGALRALVVDQVGEPAVTDPEVRRPDAPDGVDVVLVGVPRDIEAVRRADPGRALRWRLALRAVLGPMLNDTSWRVDGFAKSGWYVARRGGGG